jgi:hypothetical protein
MEGNCVDRFIERKINKLISNLQYAKCSIIDRIQQRSITHDYFNTSCYEQDFADIRKLRDEAQLLVENCNKFLERISEQYSKLN